MTIRIFYEDIKTSAARNMAIIEVMMKSGKERSELRFQDFNVQMSTEKEFSKNLEPER